LGIFVRGPVSSRLFCKSSRAVAKDIGSGVNGLAAPKINSYQLSGVDRDLKQIEEAIASLQSGKESARYSALSTLSGVTAVEAKRKQVAKLIVPSLKNRSVRKTELTQAVSAIGVWGDSSHAKYLLRLIPKAQGFTRLALFKPLGKIGDEKISGDLLKLLKDEKVGFQVVEAFGKLSADTESELENWLSSEDVYLRAKAATVLGKAGGSSAGATLEKFMKTEPDTIAFTQAIQALA